MKLSITDYKKILKFYKLSVPKNKKSIEKKANKIIADKFCSCIKKVQQKFREEGIAIGICTNSVINRKGYKRGKFKCKKRRTINLHKGGKRRKKKTRKKRGKGATISRFFVEPDYTWNVEQFDGRGYNFGAAEEALESYMNEYGSPPHTREYQLHRLEQQRRIINDFHNSRNDRWLQHLDRARQVIFQQMGNEPLPQARTEEDFRHLMQNHYSGNQSPGAAGGGKRKKKTRRKRGKGGVFSCKNCGDKKKKKEESDFYYEDGVKKYFYDSDYSSVYDSDISDEYLTMADYEKKSIKEQPNKRPVSPLLSKKEQQDERLSPTFGQFAKIETYTGGKRRRKTRKKRGGMESNTPSTRPNTPTTVETEAQQAPFIPPFTLPPPAIRQRPIVTSFGAHVVEGSYEEAMQDNMTQAMIGSNILETLTLYLNDYNSRVQAGEFTPRGNFGELLNNDVNNFRDYVQYLNQSGGCFPNCKNIKKKCVGCLKPARVEPTPLGVVMDNEGNLIQDGRASDGRIVREEDGPYEIWILNRRIARLNSEGRQLEKQIKEAESPFQKTGLQKSFDDLKKQWLEAKRQLLVEENKIAATTVAYPAEPVAMRR